MNSSPLFATALCAFSCTSFANSPAPPEPVIPVEPDRAESYRMFQEHFATRRFDEALGYAQQVVKHTQRQFGPEPPQLITPLTDLGTTQLRLNDYAAAERSFLRALNLVERYEERFSRGQIPPLLGLGLARLAAGQAVDAIDPLSRAVSLSRRADGLWSPRQMEAMEPLIDCFLALDLQKDLEYAQQYALRIEETAFGKDDPRLVPALQRGARWYEQARRYFSARQWYARAMQIVHGRSGETDLRLVEPLRGIARSFRQEYLYGLHGLDADPNPMTPDPLRSESYVSSTTGRHLDYKGEESLKQAVRIVKSHPQATRELRAAVLLDLGDWYQTGEMTRQAMQAYKEAWQEMTAPGGPGTEALDRPVPLIYESMNGQLLNKAPPIPEVYDLYRVELKFMVTREGRVKGIEVAESNAPKDIQTIAAYSLEKTHYRPRFVEGEPVDTPDVQHRQKLYYTK